MTAHTVSGGVLVRRYDLVSTVSLMALAVYVTMSGLRLGFGAWHEPGPGFLPVLFGLLLGGLAGIWCVMAVVGGWADRTARPFFADRGGLRKFGLTLGALMAYGWLLERLGFPLTTLLFLMFLLRAIEPQRWRLTLTTALVTMILCVLVFQIWLQVQLPDGPMSLTALRRWVF
jgi:putative tricarboxylic transport membrane protein